MANTVPDHSLLRLSVEIVSAHVAGNTVPADSLPDLIRTVYAALSEAGAPEQPDAGPQQPAVPVRKSVFPGYLVCLEDGKKMKMLKRHLRSAYGLTPDQYRAKWHLPASYPMVSPDYATHRSGLAKLIGLGRKPAEVEPEPEIQVKHIPLGVRGRKPKPSKIQPAADTAPAERS